MSKETVQHEHSSQARVSVSFKRTFNTGNYSSLSVEVGAWDDCGADESIQDGMERVQETVEEQFEQLCDRIEGKKGGQKK